MSSVHALPPHVARILVATDFTTASITAFQFAMRLATIFHAHLAVLHVNEYSEAASPSAGGIPKGLFALHQSAERQLDELKHRAEQHGLKVEAILVDGIASVAILDAIQANEIDLVVTGTKGARGLERFVLGSTAETVFRKASCPVMITGPGVSSLENSFQSAEPVIFATDLSPVSARGARYADYLCKQTGSSLHCLHVLQESQTGSPDQAAADRASTAAMQQIANESGLAVESVVYAVSHNKKVSTGIAEYAKQHGAALIALGIQRAPVAAGHLPAQITYKIIEEATCPVLTVAS